MGKAIGIGGVFIHMNGDAKELFDWYERLLGLEFSAYGTGFLSGTQLMVLTFKRDDDPRMPYLNFRVDDIETIVEKLKQERVDVYYGIETFDYGKFARFVDPFGNAVELWEADAKAYVAMAATEVARYRRDKKPHI